MQLAYVIAPGRGDACFFCVGSFWRELLQEASEGGVL